MKTIKPVGKWIWAKPLIGGEKKTTAGIIYREKSKYKLIYSEVLAVGNRLTEDIKIGDKIIWDVSKLKDGFGGHHLVHQDWIVATER